MYNPYVLVSSGVAARELGVRSNALRRREAEGRIEASERTVRGWRRYDLAKLRRLALHEAQSERTTALYARVFTTGQKDDLFRQVTFLQTFPTANGWSCEVIEDAGSVPNYQKKGLKQLIAKIYFGEIKRLVVAHKDRLLRSGAKLVLSLCDHFGTEIAIVNALENSAFKEDLANDVLEILRSPPRGCAAPQLQEPPGDRGTHQGG